MQKILVAVIASAIVVAMLSTFGTLTAFANPSPGVPGEGGPNPSTANNGGAHPGASNTATSVNCGSGNAASTPPGQTGQSQSPFAPVNNGGTPTKSASNYNSGSPGQPGGSQYDTACFQATQH